MTREAPFLWGAATAGHQVEGNNVKTKMCADDAASTTSKKAG